MPVLPVFTVVFTGFFHCPGKNTFCRGKNPTLSGSHHHVVRLYRVYRQWMPYDRLFYSNSWAACSIIVSTTLWWWHCSVTSRALLKCIPITSVRMESRRPTASHSSNESTRPPSYRKVPPLLPRAMTSCPARLLTSRKTLQQVLEAAGSATSTRVGDDDSSLAKFSRGSVEKSGADRDGRQSRHGKKLWPPDHCEQYCIQGG